MGNMDEQILRASKEIMVKFIETGRVSPTGFSETFKEIYHTIEETVNSRKPSVSESEQKEKHHPK